MTKQFAQQKIRDLEMYLATLKNNYDSLKERLGKSWIDATVHEILDEMQYYKDFLDSLDDSE
jgi:predicted lipase